MKQVVALDGALAVSAAASSASWRLQFYFSHTPLQVELSGERDQLRAEVASLHEKIGQWVYFRAYAQKWSSETIQCNKLQSVKDLGHVKK